MKALKSKTTSSNLQTQTQEASKPFFAKGGEGTFFSEASNDIQTKPFFSPSTIQPKLKVGQPNDKYEQEADAMADTVMTKLAQPESTSSDSSTEGTDSNNTTTVPAVQMSTCSSCGKEEKIQEKQEESEELSLKEESIDRKPIFESNDEPPEENTIQRTCADCAEKEKIQQKSDSGTSTVSTDLESQLNASKGGGNSLPKDTNDSMESAFGADFSSVKIHTDSNAVQMNQGLGAQAFTHGNDIYFNEGKYDTGSSDGKRLLAHELTHTVQQGGSALKTKPISSFANTNIRLDQYSRLRPTTVPSIQAFGLSDIGSAISAGADFISETANSAVEWAGDRIEDAIEMGADAFMAIIRQVAPSLAELIQNGPGNLISEAMNGGIQTWLSGIFGEFNLSQFVEDIRANLSNAFNLIQGVLSGDEASCQAFSDAIDAIRSFISEFMDNPFFQAIREAFDMVKGFLSSVVDMVIAPVFDTIMEIAGEAFSVVREIAGTVSGWLQSVKSYLTAAWDWVMEQLGFSGDGEGGIWEWIKGFANDIWQEIKSTFAPIIGPLQVILGILLVLSPIGPVVIAIRYGPQVVEAIQWLWNNRDNPNIVADSREEMGDGILPQLLSAGEEFISQLSTTVSDLLGNLIELGSGLLELLGGLTGIPLLEMARSFVQNLSEHVQSFITWVQESLQSAVDTMRSVFERIRTTVEPYIEILSSIGLAILNPPMIPIILAGWAWRALPDCYKPPIIDFLLDGVIGFLEAIPVLPFLGVLWPLLQPFILGFLREFRNREDHEKIAITNKLAKIISGASIDFIIGFVGGFLRGLWEGLTDPFVLLYSALNGLNSLSNWFFGLFEETPEEQSTAQPAGQASQTATATPSAATGTAAPQASTVGQTSDASQNRAALSGRMGEMGNELSPHINEVTENFSPAIEEHFQGGDSMTFDDLTTKLGSMWESAQSAISGAGQSLAQSLVEFFMQDSSERTMGDGIGWLSGTIVFEVVLGILTAGTYTAAQPVMKGLQFFAKILDWTGEVLGIAFKALSKLGGFIMTLLRKLMDMVSSAGGAISRVFAALREIGERIIRYGQELLGRLGRGAGGEVAEEATERATREATEAAAERTTREMAEAGTERTTREATEEVAEETAEEAAERGAREGADEAGEQGGRQVDEATKAAEMPLAVAEARVISEANDRINTPVGVLIGILTSTLKPRYPWIDQFNFDRRGSGRYEIYFTASPKHTIDELYDITEREMRSRDGDDVTVERRIDETDVEYRDRLEELALDDTPRTRPDGTVETSTEVTERMAEAERRHGIVDQRVQHSSSSIDGAAVREGEHAAQTEGLWRTRNGKPEVLTGPGGVKVQLGNPANMDEADLRLAQEILASRGNQNSKVTAQLRELGLEIEKRNASQAVREAQERFLREGSTDQDVFRRAMEGERHIWVEDEAQAQRIVNMLEEAGEGSPRNLDAIRGPEVHVGSQAGPREVHQNVTVVADSRHVDTHIYHGTPEPD